MSLVVYALVYPPSWAMMMNLLFQRIAKAPMSKGMWWYQYCCAAIGLVVGGITGGAPTQAGIGSIHLLVAIFMWWWDRKDRKKAKDLIGAKSKAIRDEMTRKVRELAQPAPGLQPVPGGGNW